MSKEQIEKELSGTPSMFDKEQAELMADTQDQKTLKG